MFSPHGYIANDVRQHQNAKHETRKIMACFRNAPLMAIRSHYSPLHWRVQELMIDQVVKGVTSQFITQLIMCLISILLVSAPSASAAQTASLSTGSHLDAIRSSGTLRFGIPGDYPPFGEFDKQSGQWTGIDVDVASAMARALGVRLDIVKTSWPSLLSDL
jgi:hypothetical protein